MSLAYLPTCGLLPWGTTTRFNANCFSKHLLSIHRIMHLCEFSVLVALHFLTILLMKFFLLFNMFHVTCPLVTFKCTKTSSFNNIALFESLSFEFLIFKFFKHSCKRSFNVSYWNKEFGYSLK